MSTKDSVSNNDRRPKAAREPGFYWVRFVDAVPSDPQVAEWSHGPDGTAREWLVCGVYSEFDDEELVELAGPLLYLE